MITCAICKTLAEHVSLDLKCTLHGGSMTATEVRMRHHYEVRAGEWTRRKGRPRPLDEAMIDRYEFIRDTYLLHRRSLVYDGNPPREKYDDFDSE